MPPPRCIDAHHHLWRYRPDEFGWIDDTMSPLRRDFTASELVQQMDTCGVTHAVAVQARQSLDETEFLLDCAEQCPRIAAVVGWLPLLREDIAPVAERYAARAQLVGAREILQDRPAGYMERAAFQQGIRALTANGLTYDLLLRADQLEEATRLVDQHPTQLFVLDHAAKPPIRAGELQPWAKQLRALARHENVACKISGLVTEADWSKWTAEDLAPYIDLCVEAFTPARLMAGSDWPVCLLATGYERWWRLLQRYFDSFSAPERERVFAGTAAEFYHLRHLLQREAVNA